MIEHIDFVMRWASQVYLMAGGWVFASWAKQRGPKTYATVIASSFILIGWWVYRAVAA